MKTNRQIIERVNSLANTNRTSFSYHSIKRCYEHELDTTIIANALKGKNLKVVQYQRNYKNMNGESYVLWMRYAGNDYHVVVLDNKGYLDIVTVYQPDSKLFTDGGSKVRSFRRKRVNYCFA